MTEFSSSKELTSIVNYLPEFESAKPILNLTELEYKEGSSKLKSLLSNYFSHYDLPLSHHNNKSNINLTIGKFKAFNFDVVAQVYAPVISEYKAVVFFIHGYLDHFALHKNLINLLTSNNYIIVGLDLPGHGLSTGEIAHIADFGQYAHSVELMVDCFKNKFNYLDIPAYISGYSAGAAIGTEYLLRNQSQNYFSKALWLAPLLRIPKWKFSEIAISYLPFLKYVPRDTKNISHDSRFITFIRYNDPMQPRIVPLAWIKAMHHWVARLPKYGSLMIKTCIVQGTEDKTIDWRYNIPDFSQIYLNHEVHYVYEGYHNLCNESFEYRKLAFDYIMNFYDN